MMETDAAMAVTKPLVEHASSSVTEGVVADGAGYDMEVEVGVHDTTEMEGRGAGTQADVMGAARFAAVQPASVSEDDALMVGAEDETNAGGTSTSATRAPATATAISRGG